MQVEVVVVASNFIIIVCIQFFFSRVLVVALLDCLRFVSCGGIKLGMMAAINVLVEAKNDVRAALLESRRRVRGREGSRRIRTPYARQSTGHCQPSVPSSISIK